MLMRELKFVLISESGYSPEHDALLNSILIDGVELFCVVGNDCEIWEEVMDEMAVGDGENVRYITTTSHPHESVDNVIEFAKAWRASSKSDVKVVRI